MARILGLDVGTKRIGVALSDELFLTAQGRDSLYRTELAADLDALRRLVEENAVCEVVAGLPVSMDGTHSAQTKEVAFFVERLAAHLAVPVRTWDERLTSLQAERVLLAADVSRARRRQLSDRLAAQLILQSYLDARRREQAPPAAAG